MLDSSKLLKSLNYAQEFNKICRRNLKSPQCNKTLLNCSESGSADVANAIERNNSDHANIVVLLISDKFNKVLFKFCNFKLRLPILKNF